MGVKNNMLEFFSQPTPVGVLFILAIIMAVRDSIKDAKIERELANLKSKSNKNDKRKYEDGVQNGNNK